ncbi:MAG: (2Fe-2S)-binding protein [Paludibacter sp.]|jgi:nitrite reductase (NADH) large subunit|nr:(2Fe-2S)-binding protein [Paludibacter sp.]
MVEDPVICDCNDVCKSDIVDKIKDKNLKTINEVGKELDAGTGCGGCRYDIQDILNEINN